MLCMVAQVILFFIDSCGHERSVSLASPAFGWEILSTWERELELEIIWFALTVSLICMLEATPVEHANERMKLE